MSNARNIANAESRYVNAAGDTIDGSIEFGGTGRRITGDMSSSTATDRLAFQTSTANGSTIVNAIPDGTGSNSQFRAHNGSDPANAGIGIFGITSTQLNVVATQAGSGSYLPISFQTGGSERMRIDSSGYLLVAKASATNTDQGIYLGQDGQISAVIKDTGGAQQAIFINRQDSNGTAILFRKANGTVGSISVTGSATAYNTSSDYRLKENVAPMTGALATVAALKPVTYTWKADGSAGHGFIAHELQAVVPDAVTGEKDAVDADGNPQYQGVDTSFLVATLTAAIQELKAELDAVKAEVASLRAY